MIRIINEKGKNIVMGGQQAEMLPGGGFHGGLRRFPVAVSTEASRLRRSPVAVSTEASRLRRFPVAVSTEASRLRHFPEVVSTAVSRRKLFPEVASINGRLLREDALQCRRILPRAISIDI